MSSLNEKLDMLEHEYKTPLLLWEITIVPFAGGGVKRTMVCPKCHTPQIKLFKYYDIACATEIYDENTYCHYCGNQNIVRFENL